MQDSVNNYHNSEHWMVVRNTLIVCITLLGFFSVGMVTVLYYHQQETNKMQACVKSGKEWTVIKPDDHSPNIEHVCLDKK